MPQLGLRICVEAFRKYMPLACVKCLPLTVDAQFFRFALINIFIPRLLCFACYIFYYPRVRTFNHLKPICWNLISSFCHTVYLSIYCECFSQ